MIEVAANRPPYVVFELRPVEDREASISAGHFVAKDVAYAIITPQGSKDRIDRVAGEWFAQLEQQTREERFPREWLIAFKAAFKDWSEGREPSLSGTDVRNWPAASPAQVAALLNARIRTVEDIATANEEALSRLGMGGRALKAKAIEWLTAAAGPGKFAETLAALKAENSDLQERNASLERQLQELAKRLANFELAVSAKT